MQIFISAGNSGAGANTVGDPAVATQLDHRRLVHHQGDLAVELWLDPVNDRPAPVLLARPA